ncbi:cell division protein ZapA [Burkholderiaceae bacterium DAT-1]|nr:cell division protein ZapA [Burkholderiaceae bacterium DAT-1]
MSDRKEVDINIMGREFRVACPADEETALLEAAIFIDRKMKEIRDSGNVMGIDKIAIMAALNIAHEYMNTRVGGGFDMADIRRKIAGMESLIDDTLNEPQQNLF